MLRLDLLPQDAAAELTRMYSQRVKTEYLSVRIRALSLMFVDNLFERFIAAVLQRQ